jgi:hypothetical protein
VRLAGALHRLTRAEQEARRHRHVERPKIDWSFATLEELDELIPLLREYEQAEKALSESGAGPTDELRALADRANAIVAQVREREARGERPPSSRRRTREHAEQADAGEPTLVEHVEYEHAERRGETTRPNEDGTTSVLVGPGKELRLAFDPNGEPDLSLAEGAAAAVAPTGATTADGSEDPEPAEQPEPEPPPVPPALTSAPTDDWRSSPYDDNSDRVWRSKASRAGESLAAQYGIDRGTIF